MTEPRDRLDEAAKEFTAADEARKQAKEAVEREIVEALRAGVSPTEVNKLAPFTPAYVRRIAREAGVDPRPPGPKKKEI